MKNWSKALLLASLFYALVILLFFYTELPKAKKMLHTPLNMSLFEEPVQKKSLYPPQKIEKKREKEPLQKKIAEKQPDAKTSPKMQTPKNEINATIADIKDNVLRKDAFIPSMSQINSAFKIKEPKKQVTKEIKDLYGDMVNNMSSRQLEYLDENLNTIGIITQKYLQFPTLAGELGMHGESILEFNLYPNGDISKILLLKSSGYAMLDDNAIETVMEAYKEYPHPKEKTKIRLLVKYINDYR